MYYVTRVDGRPVLPGDRVGSTGGATGWPLIFVSASGTMVYVRDGQTDAGTRPLVPYPPAVFGLRILRPDHTVWPEAASALTVRPHGRDGSLDLRYVIRPPVPTSADMVVLFEGVAIGGASDAVSACVLATRHLMARLYRQHEGAS